MKVNRIILQYTERISNSNSAFCLAKSLDHLHTSGAFFLTFHDATYYMKGPFDYSIRISWFLFSKWLFFGVFRNLSKKQPFTKQNRTIFCEYSNGPFIWSMASWKVRKKAPEMCRCSSDLGKQNAGFELEIFSVSFGRH